MRGAERTVNRAATRRAVARAGAVLSVVVIGSLTLAPVSGSVSSLSPTCILCGDHGIADAAANLLLFAPLGAALALGDVRPGRAAILALLLSLTIEIAQQFLPGRTPTIRDVALNGAGALLAASLVASFDVWTSARHARWLAWASAPLPALVVVSSGWLLTAIPTHDTYFSLWAPRLRNLARWDGEVRSAAIGARALPPGRLERSADLSGALVRGDVMRLELLAGTATPRLAAIFAIYDRDTRQIVLVGADGVDLVVAQHRRATAFRLDEPLITFPSHLAGVPKGEELAMMLEFEPRGACVSGLRSRECRRPVGVGSAWTLLAWQGGWVPANLVLVMNAAMLLALVTPVAFWSARARMPAAAAAMVVPLIAAGWWPSPLGWTRAELTGVALGLALGTWLAGRGLRRIEGPAIMRPHVGPFTRRPGSAG